MASLGHFETNERNQSLPCVRPWIGANLPLVQAVSRLGLDVWIIGRVIVQGKASLRKE